MNWIDKLERKFGRYGIPNLTFYIVICYVLGYILMYANPSLLNMMSLEPARILQGQVWRLVTWVIYPPSTGNFLLFAISILFFYYPIGTSLERTWGTFRYNLYIFSGLLFVMIAAFLTYSSQDGSILWAMCLPLIMSACRYFSPMPQLAGYADPSVVCHSH